MYCWLIRDVAEGFGHFCHQRPLCGTNQYLNPSSTSKNCHQLSVSNITVCIFPMKMRSQTKTRLNHWFKNRPWILSPNFSRLFLNEVLSVTRSSKKLFSFSNSMFHKILFYFVFLMFKNNCRTFNSNQSFCVKLNSNSHF